MKNSRLFSIFLIVFVDMLGFGLILPLLPYYAEKYGANAIVIGLLTASYAAAQLIGAPILGRLSDRYGRRPILMMSVLGTLVGFLLLGFADPIGRALANLIAPGTASLSLQNLMVLVVLFFSRILDGATGGNITVAQAYISDITDQENRGKSLGLIGAAFGLGFILGPAIGGILATWGYAIPALVAAGFAFVNLMLIYFRLPESITDEIRQRALTEKRVVINANALWQAINRPRVGPLLHIRFFFGLAFATFQSIFPLYAQTTLGLTPQQTGFVLTYVGILAAVIQGVGIGILTRRYTDVNLIVISSVLMTLSLIGWALTPNVWVLLIILAPLAFSGGVLNTVLSSTLTKVVYPEEVGGTLGLSTSIESFTRVLAPTAGGFLLGSIGAWAPGVFSAILMGWVTSFAWRRLVLRPDPPLPVRNQPVSVTGD